MFKWTVMKVKKAFALFDIHVLVKKKGISVMLHRRQALLVAIEGIYSHYHHGNSYTPGISMFIPIYKLASFFTSHSPFGHLRTMVNVLKDTFCS